MKLIQVFCLAALLFVSACSDKTDATKGGVENGTFHYPELGLSIPIPKDWVVRPTRRPDAAPGAGEAALEKKRVNRLLFTCLENNNCNNSILVVLQPASPARGGTDPQKHLQYLIDREDEHHRQYQIKGHYTKGTQKIGGKEFQSLTVKRQNKNTQFQKLEQAFLFRIIGDQVLTITLNYEEERYKKAIMEALENAELDK